MPKARSVYICQQCGASSPKWVGRCPDCGAWNSLVETVVAPRKASERAQSFTAQTPQPISKVTSDGFARLLVPMEELNRVLGGGIVPGSVVLIGGDPGIGKSTLLLQVSALLASAGRKVLYVSGEESAQQIRMRAERLDALLDTLYVLAETQIEPIVDQIDRMKPDLAVVDSIQAVYASGMESSPGNVGQVKECAAQLQRLAKATHIPVFVVGHVTKSGLIAGPRVLEHIVDTVLYLEGERFHSYRLLRSVKNRFGSTNEVGVFVMGEQGLQEVPNPSEAFLAERLPAVPGSAIAVTLEGSRPLLVEVQGLASTTSFGLPRRTGNGVDMGRLLLLAAVLSRRVGLRLSDQDLFVNVVGGLKVSEPAADLAIAAAIASSVRNAPLMNDTAVIGEIGLSGELRSVSQMDRRLTEATRLGFTRCLVPQGSVRGKGCPDGLELLTARTLDEALGKVLVR